MIKRISYCCFVCLLFLGACSPKTAKVLDDPTSNEETWVAQDSLSVEDEPEVFDSDPFQEKEEECILMDEPFTMANKMSNESAIMKPA